MIFSLMIDGVTIALLIATIFYAIVLNKRIVSIHNNREELQKLLDGFSESLKIAEKSIAHLKGAGVDAVHAIESHLSQATTLRDDLKYMIDRGEKLANTLENNIRARIHPAEETAPPTKSSDSFQAPYITPEIPEETLSMEEDVEIDAPSLSKTKKKLMESLQQVR